MTDTDAALWTAVAAGLGAAVSGAVAVIVTSRQVRSSERLAEEARHQERLLRGYLTLMRYVDAWIAGVMSDRDLLIGVPRGTTRLLTSRLPIEEVSWEDRAFSALVCSEAVGVLQEQFNGHVRSYLIVVAPVTMDLGTMGPDQFEREHAKLGAKAAILMELGEALIRSGDSFLAQMRRELKAVGNLPPHVGNVRTATTQGSAISAGSPPGPS